MHLAAARAAITFVCVANCVVTVSLRSHITLWFRWSIASRSGSRSGC